VVPGRESLARGTGGKDREKRRSAMATRVLIASSAAEGHVIVAHDPAADPLQGSLLHL
jgi:hypothetical protein